MSLDIPSIQEIDGNGLRIAIIASRYNEALVDSLVHHAGATLTAAGAEAPLIERVPGAAELPFAASTLAHHSSFNAIIVINQRDSCFSFSWADQIKPFQPCNVTDLTTTLNVAEQTNSIPR